MNVSEYEVINGLDKLQSHLRKEKDRWIKMTPQYRGSVETFHHQDYESSREKLAELALKFGCMQDDVTFISEKPIPSKIEGGIDTYTIDGQHPSICLTGYEKKDLCYFSAVKKYGDVAKEITSVCEPLWPALKNARCRQFISTEVKVTDDDESWLLEPTLRLPVPPGGELMELFGNISDIIYRGSNGELVEPEPIAKYGCEAMIQVSEPKNSPRELEVPPDVRQWVKLWDCAKVGKKTWLYPNFDKMEIGSIIGVGNTPIEALESLKEHSAELEGQPVKVCVHEIASLIEEIELGQKHGLSFSDEPLPEPAEVLT